MMLDDNEKYSYPYYEQSILNKCISDQTILILPLPQWRIPWINRLMLMKVPSSSVVYFVCGEKE
jgi:hypothetical protein